ncbi:MAG: hypothetical protein Q9219_006373, partial [cf. Caloplaca sp. 3 TL-2023]
MPVRTHATEGLTVTELQELMELAPAALDDANELSGRRKDPITNEEARAISGETLDVLFDAWAELRSIIAQHENDISRLWYKKTIVQRKELLSRVWSRMPEIHRPDLALLRTERKTKGFHQKPQFTSDSHLRFPHINLEDLSKFRPLVLLLSSRSRHFPSTFVNADRQSIRVGIRSKMLVPKYIEGHTMYLVGEKTRHGYGRIVSWEQDRRALVHCLVGIALDPGLGIMILDIQREVLQFLVRCSREILLGACSGNFHKHQPMTASASSVQHPPRPDIRRPWNNLLSEIDTYTKRARL